MSDNVRIFDPQTGRYEAPRPDQAHLVAEHKAQRAGKPAPGDRTAEEIAAMDITNLPPTLTPADVEAAAQAIKVEEKKVR